MSQLIYWLWLSAAENVSVSSKAKLLSHYKDAEAVFNAPSKEMLSLGLLSKREADILKGLNISDAKQVQLCCERQKLQIVTQHDALYPERLKNIPSPPAVLYVKGRLPLLDEEPALAVVGTRRATPYGLKMAEDIAWEIAKCGGVVLSGLTEGIDAAAAKGALAADGICVGVLGTPHEADRGDLSRKVADTGAVISEYPPGTKAQRSFFRDRNRITSGLSVGVVAVEAPEKSGTRLFVAEAAEQGKEVFAVPGNADSPNSAGTLAFIKEGAALVTRGREAMEEIAPLFPQKVKIPDVLEPPDKPKSAADEEINRQSAKKVIDKEKSRGYIDLKDRLPAMSEEQLKIAEIIGDKAVHIDDLIEKAGLSTAQVLAQLTYMELQGLVQRESGRRFRLNIPKK